MDDNQNYGQDYNNYTDPYEYSYTPSQDYTYVIKEDEPKKRERRPVNFTRGGIALLVILCIILGLGSGIGGALLVGQTNTNGTTPPTTVLYQSIRTDGANSESGYAVADIVAAVADTVVEISTEAVSIGGGWQKDYVTSGAGSGVILSTDGYVITCAHVIDDATQVHVILNNGVSHKATVIGYDSESDIAVLKINASGLHAAVLGDSKKTIVGESVIAVGNPLGNLGGTVTNGIVSALDREITVEGYDMTLLQTNASVSPGNSGGGLFNSYGELIGIVNAKSTGTDVEGIGFAIPINLARDMAEGIIERGYGTERPALGVVVVEITNEEAKQEYDVSTFGVYVASVNSDSAAQKGGVRVGDLIIKVDGKKVEKNADLTVYLDTCRVGQTIVLTVVRGDATIDLSVTLEQYRQSSY